MIEREWPLAGMTVNERLFACGLLGQWRAAATARDRATMLGLMRTVAVDPPEPTVDAILADPAFYGF